ncbi:MAG TPA: hypothetical protein VGG99_00765 [Acetobacteraceae bacterium]|jgi:hypothetical protein
MLAEWNKLSDALQLTLSQEALRRAAETIAGQAEVLAEEIESGALADRGGPDALRLLAMVVRAAEPDPYAGAGHA